MLSLHNVPPDSGIAKSNLPPDSDLRINMSPDQPITALASPRFRSSEYELPFTWRINPSAIFPLKKSIAFIN